MKKLTSGFTLVELLVVMGILASLATIVLISLNSQTGRARDLQRKSDIRQYQTALETYANRNNGLYPVSNTTSEMDAICSANTLSETCPDDKDATKHYYYRTDTSGTRYVIWAMLEAKPTNDVFIVCSNGEVGEMTGSAFTSGGGVGSSANCPI